MLHLGLHYLTMHRNTISSWNLLTSLYGSGRVSNISGRVEKSDPCPTLFIHMAPCSVLCFQQDNFGITTLAVSYRPSLHVPKIIEFYWCISLLQKCKVVSFLLAQLVLCTAPAAVLLRQFAKNSGRYRTSPITYGAIELLHACEIEL